MNTYSVWFSLGPLLGFNVILLGTVFAFRPVYRKREKLVEVENRHASRFLNRWMREYWLWLTDPFVRLLARLKISPNVITVFGVLIAVGSGYCFWEGRFGLGGWLMILAATFDIFDGRVARATNNVTKSGAYFDSVMDRISEGAVFLGLLLYYKNHWAFWIVFLALLGSLMVSYTRAQGEAQGVDYSGGSMQRPERIVYLGVGAIFAPIIAYLLSFYLPYSFRLMIDYFYLIPLTLVAIMTWVTAFNRMKNVMRMLDQK